MRNEWWFNLFCWQHPSISTTSHWFLLPLLLSKDNSYLSTEHEHIFYLAQTEMPDVDIWFLTRIVSKCLSLMSFHSSLTERIWTKSKKDGRKLNKTCNKGDEPAGVTWDRTFFGEELCNPDWRPVLLTVISCPTGLHGQNSSYWSPTFLFAATPDTQTHLDSILHVLRTMLQGARSGHAFPLIINAHSAVTWCLRFVMQRTSIKCWESGVPLLQNWVKCKAYAIALGGLSKWKVKSRWVRVGNRLMDK